MTVAGWMIVSNLRGTRLQVEKFLQYDLVSICKQLFSRRSISHSILHSGHFALVCTGIWCTWLCCDAITRSQWSAWPVRTG